MCIKTVFPILQKNYRPHPGGTKLVNFFWSVYDRKSPFLNVPNNCNNNNLIVADSPVLKMFELNLELVLDSQ